MHSFVKIGVLDANFAELPQKSAWVAGFSRLHSEIAPSVRLLRNGLWLPFQRRPSPLFQNTTPLLCNVTKKLHKYKKPARGKPKTWAGLFQRLANNRLVCWPSSNIEINQRCGCQILSFTGIFSSSMASEIGSQRIPPSEKRTNLWVLRQRSFFSL